MTGFLGGINLGTPAERNEIALRRELELWRTRKPHSGWGKVYPTGADLLLRHGRFYPGAELPEQYQHLVGELGQCFWNCARAGRTDPSLRYCEGLAAIGVGQFSAHAWCLDPDDRVLDLTWEGGAGEVHLRTRMRVLPHRHWSYFGVILRPELMLDTDGIEMPLLGRDEAAERTNTIVTEDGRWLTPSGLDVTPPAKLPLLDVPYDPNRTEFT